MAIRINNNIIIPNLSGDTVCQNTALGISALANNTSGCCNTALGYAALNANTTGGCNTAIGINSLQANTTGVGNVAVGTALYSNNGGNNNIGLGWQALNNNTIGNCNIALGRTAMNCNTTGHDNVAIGNQALYSNTGGSNNLAIGNSALSFNTTGNHNVAIGSQALVCNTGSNNFAVGFNALYCNTSGSNNTAIGCNALYCNTGSYNLAMGFNALRCNTAGYGNIAMGSIAGCQINTGCYNTIIGGVGPADGSNQLWLQAGSNCLAVSSGGSLTLNGAAVGGSGPRIYSTASILTTNINASTTDQYNITALAANLSVVAPSGTPSDGQKLMIRIKDNGTPWVITWTTTTNAFRAVGVGLTLPQATIASKVTYVGSIWNAQDSYWDVVGVSQLQ
jgi:hypothetical protein